MTSVTMLPVHTEVNQPRPQGFSLKNPFFKGKALGTRLEVNYKRWLGVNLLKLAKLIV